MVHSLGSCIGKGDVIRVVIQQMNPGHLANLTAVDVTGQRAFQVAARIAVHDKRHMINTSKFNGAFDCGYALAADLI